MTSSEICCHRLLKSGVNVVEAVQQWSHLRSAVTDLTPEIGVVVGSGPTMVGNEERSHSKRTPRIV
ncbi:hypothetical protein J6590_036968 [Homalodisca vitripennis]|nr:hypothetical protein J6590_036968 [Homalodisca vitripennis]